MTFPLLEAALTSKPRDDGVRRVVGVCRQCVGDGCEACEGTGICWVQLPFDQMVEMANILRGAA